jgi:leucine dehydrogenase
VTDVNVARVQEATAKFDATAVEPETIVMAKYDVLSPNALGAILDDDTIPRLHARHSGCGRKLADVKAAV